MATRSSQLKFASFEIYRKKLECININFGDLRLELASIRDEPQYLEWTQPLFSLVEKCESAKLNKYIIARCRAAVLASGASSGAAGAAHPGYTKMEN